MERKNQADGEMIAYFVESLVNELKKDGINLDYSPESIAEVDKILVSLRDEKDKEKRMARASLLGAYVGEVIVRRHGGKWIMGDEKITEDPDLSIPVVSLPSLVVNPIQKAMRYANGVEGDELVLLYKWVVFLLKNMKEGKGPIDGPNNKRG